MAPAPVAIVTGAARGIGAATVHRLATAGWRVVAVDICTTDPALGYPLSTPGQLRAVAQAHKESVIATIADVRDLTSVKGAVDLACARFGGLDAAVACAAVMPEGRPLWETTSAQWDPMFDVGVHGTANLARAAVPAMLSRPTPRNGRFVGVTSVAVVDHTSLHLSGYTAANHAVAGLIKGLAHDLRGTGISATALTPGATRTALLNETARLPGIESVEELANHRLSSRILEPEEIAEAIAWLCTLNPPPSQEAFCAQAEDKEHKDYPRAPHQ
jgi:SDR family mycofactocin-dependent oxidoreductase